MDSSRSCNIEITLRLLNGKWKLAILHHLFHSETLRFSDLQRRLNGITPKVLTAHLKLLENEGVVQRTVYPETPPRVHYALTSHGRSLEKVVLSLYSWGAEHTQVPSRLI